MTTGRPAHLSAPAGDAALGTSQPLCGRPPRRVSGWLAVALASILVVAAVQPLAGSSGSDPVVVDQVLGLSKVEPGVDTSSGVARSMVVQARPGHESQARREITAAGGVVDADLPYVHGFEATLTGPQVAAVAASPAVHSVSINHQVTFEDLTYDDTTTASNFARTSEATVAWAAGHLGGGVGVAVLDTGVSSMPDFDGRIVFGPDLSGEGSTVDTHGHGTVMAGIVGGNGADSAARAGGAFTGVAPRATLVAVKVAGRNGVVDVSTMLQGMHWVSAYKDQFNIRVMNLAWGTTSNQSPSLDPLNYAVQRLWQEGVVVVAAAGNSGPQAGTVTKPGDDPLVITAGAYDDKQNFDPADDSLPSWSSRGPTAGGLAKPDLVASGRFLTAARSFGSHVELTYPKALVAPSYIRGSGTSEAAAVTSGVVALLLAEHPSLTPDQVKSVLTRSGSPLPSQPASAQGSGRLRLGVARSLAVADPGPTAWQQPTATGLGSIEASRDGVNVETDCEPDGVLDVIQGEIDVRCEAWTPDSWTGSRWTGEAWTGAEWTGSRWTGGEWTAASWYGSAWTGSRWTGSRWTGSRWTGSRWTGSRWTGTDWTTAGYDDFTSFGYEEDTESGFLNAFWGPRPRAGQRLPGEVAEEHGLDTGAGGLRAI